LSADDIKKGTLTIPNGGTGATTTGKARENLSVNLMTFTGLKQIGITTGNEESETIEGIVDALPAYSELVYEVGTANNTKIYPGSYGVLRVIKINTTRTHFYFYLKSNNIYYFGNYDSSTSVPWKGWVTVYNSENLPTPAYNHKTFELTDENVNTLKTSGFYVAAGGNTCTGTPFPEGTSFGLETMRTAGTHYVQMLYSANLGSYIRFFDGNKWSAWSKQGCTETFNVSIPVSWTEDTTNGGYKQTVTVSDIVASDNPTVDVTLGNNAATNKTYLEAWGCIDRITTATNSITLYAYRNPPKTAFSIQLKVVR
jgi:hypothetical protein